MGSDSVLVVEEDHDAAIALERVLCDAGYRVTIASSCESAMQVEGVFDCAILNLHLPDGTGLELAAALQAAHMTEHTIFFTRNATSGAIRWGPGGRIIIREEEGTERLLSLLAAGAGQP